MPRGAPNKALNPIVSLAGHSGLAFRYEEKIWAIKVLQWSDAQTDSSGLKRGVEWRQ